MKVAVVANTSWFIYNFQRRFLEDLRIAGHEVITVAPPDATTVRLEERRFRSVPMAMERSGFNPVVEWRALGRLRRIYEAERPDMVFQSTIKPVIYGSIAAQRAGITRVFNMIPGLGYVFAGRGVRQRLLRPLVKSLYRYALRRSSRVFFQNPDDRRYFVENGLVSETAAEITWGLGVDMEYFQPAEAVAPRSGGCFLLIARMLAEKGVGEFVAAAETLHREYPKARFQLLGKVDEGNPGGISAAALRSWHEAGVVEYLGEVDDVRPFLAAADVVVLPSYYREGMPNALLEAMAMGKPVITTDAPGCRETVREGVTGLLVPPRDVAALAAAMRLMIADPARRRTMGERGRMFAQERFDVRLVNAQLLKAMEIS
jgi:glycosyltransferase involved in cell wall biosynthesis